MPLGKDLRYRSNTTDLVDILERKTQGLIGRTRWGVDAVDSFKESLASGLGLGFLLPSLVPWAVGGDIDHVVAVEAGDGDERHGLRVITNFFNATLD